MQILNNVHIVEQHFICSDPNESSAASRVYSRETWFEVVESNYRHEAIVLLMKSSPARKDTKKTVTAIKSGLPMKRYKPLTRCQIMRKSQVL